MVTPSGKAVVWAGRSKRTQWVHVPTGASGSSTIIAKHCIPSGGAVHVSVGETSAPSQVNFVGIFSPFEKLGLEIANVIGRPPEKWHNRQCQASIPRKEACQNQVRFRDCTAERLTSPQLAVRFNKCLPTNAPQKELRPWVEPTDIAPCSVPPKSITIPLRPIHSLGARELGHRV